ncbi:PAS sensor-containing response regulator [Arcobacter acticola]|uniref:PAS sensor-containing response regulator n=1 Tax=Arcobacter acticola TaxID=1849015 RepID=A0A6M8ELU3_9BACT|nr:response regulator [Arcobacter acticola]QKE27891.1 PAS sensor-containing response regulator [Arcobacter acticola]
MSIDKNLLKRLTLLYVEDDDIIRNELSQLLANFFSQVLVAKDGKEGLRTFLENQDTIDIVLTDINMPLYNGIEMVKKIRNIDSKISVIFATAYSDNEFLLDAIKLRVQEYIIKPIDIRKLLSFLNDIASNLYQEFLLKQQQYELTKYKEILDSNNIVIKTDARLNITYVNQLFCDISGYSDSELIGKEFKSLKFPDVSNDIYTDLYAKVLNNKPWHGNLKNIKKDKTHYTCDAHVFPTLGENGEMNGAISIQKDITKELNKKREIQLALMRDKSDIFIRSKEGSLEQNQLINDLRFKLQNLQVELEQSVRNVDKYMYSNEKYRLENKNLKTEIGLYKKNNNSSTALKLNRENSDLRIENKKLKEKLLQIELDDEKKLSQLRVYSDETRSELEDKISELTEQLESLQTDDVLKQKFEYWKDKAKAETARIENLEKQIIAYADGVTLNKIFG